MGGGPGRRARGAGCVAAPDSLKSEKKYRDLKILINRAPEYLAATTFTTVLILHVSDTGNNAE